MHYAQMPIGIAECRGVTFHTFLRSLISSLKGAYFVSSEARTSTAYNHLHKLHAVECVSIFIFAQWINLLFRNQIPDHIQVTLFTS